MVNNPKTAIETLYTHDEYYVGEKDKQGRRNGQGENCWSGAKSLESYNGHLYCDTMHGDGSYRWRYYGIPGHFYTYEGHMYANQKNGYGTMSFPDGRVFDGLFINDMRWGPGVETFPNQSQNIGLWRGAQLVRLTWRPSGLTPIPDFLSVPHGRLAVQKHRRVLRENSKHVVPEVNSAQELLKQHGCDPIKIGQLWPKLYPKHCTDLQSHLCHVEAFDKDYNGKRLIHTLDEIEFNQGSSLNSSIDEEIEGEEEENQSTKPEQRKFYAWNNCELILNIMQQCYKYHRQKKPVGFDISAVLVGPRSRFKSVASHEKNCRAMFLSCYTGNVHIVTRLANEFCVYPDITDSAGNNPIMYATCGDKTTIIHFLVQASSSVDYMNDSCCTPLGVALLRFACSRIGVAPHEMLQALLPPATTNPVTAVHTISDWIIRQESSVASATLQRQNKGSFYLKSKVVEDEKLTFMVNNEDDNFVEDYENIKKRYNSKVYNLFQVNYIATTPSYMFNVHEMINDVVEDDLVHKKLNKSVKSSKIDKLKSVKATEEDINIYVEEAIELQGKIRATIEQLLCDGADPKLVKFPQPALVIAVTSKCASLVKELIDNGATVHENYPDLFNYTALDLAISQQFTQDSVDVVKVLLENGADCNHRLYYIEYDDALGAEVQIPGPNLLHAVLCRKIDVEDTEQEDRRLEILQLLIEHNCNALAQFKGQSPLDIAMTKNKNLLCAFVINGYTNLNGIINENNQSVLVKMFTISYFKSLESPLRLQILADLVLHGANPLVKCQNGGDHYENILVYIEFVLSNIQPSVSLDEREKKTDKAKKSNKGNAEIKKKPNKGKVEKRKQLDKSKQIDSLRSLKSRLFIISSSDLRDYKLAQALVKEYARMLHIRWLQAKLMSELVQIVYKHKHRTWNMIIKEHIRKNAVVLWLTPERCLEIWDILSTTKKKIYTNPMILKYLLYIVQFYKIAKTLHEIQSPFMTATEKSQVENQIQPMLREYFQQKDKDLLKTLKTSYASPELALKEDTTFNVCFECSLPLPETKVLCENCDVVSFCDMKCLIKNLEKPDCHPCNEFLKMKYLVMRGEE